MMTKAFLAAGFALVLTCCAKDPDPRRVQELFNECMEKAKDGGLMARVMSPTDECHRYAERVAYLEANQ
jgi:hypothetical protein